MQKNPLLHARYHGTNTFAKENYRDRIHPGIGSTVPASDARGRRTSGRWQPDVSAPRLHFFEVAKLGEDRGGILS